MATSYYALDEQSAVANVRGCAAVYDLLRPDEPLI
jgi:hypothetical protein